MKIENILVTVIRTVTLTMSICLMTNLSASAANIIFCDTDEDQYDAVEKLSNFLDEANKDMIQDDNSMILSYVSDKQISEPSVSVTYTQNSQEVPEPLTILGTGVAFGLGSILKRNSLMRLNFGDD